MSETETQIDTEVPEEVDSIQPVYEGECPSVSGRSTLKFVIGKHETEGSWYLRIAENTGKGRWFDGWASAAEIDEIVKGSSVLTAASFHALHPGRSINTGGFVMAALKALGLIRTNDENSRLHEHAPTETFERVALAAIYPGATPKKPKKAKEGA